MIAGANEPNDADAAGAETGSCRQCALTREVCDPEDLIRFVADPGGQIVPDLSRKLPGRGVWLTCGRAHVEAAVKAKTFAKALKCKVEASETLPDLIEQLLSQRAISALSLANKSGVVIAGFVKVETAVQRGEVVALIHADDAAEDGTRKLDRKHTGIAEELGRQPIVIRHFRNAELSLALGRENVVHAAIKTGGAGKAFIKEATRLAKYRANSTLGAGSRPRSGR